MDYLDRICEFLHTDYFGGSSVSKWFLSTIGHKGLNDLLAAYPDNKRAYALCTFAYCEGKGKDVLLFEGKTMGKIVPSRGPPVFGWDAIFEPDEGQGKTYAEMDKDKKNLISHRFRALEKLRAHLKA